MTQRSAGSRDAAAADPRELVASFRALADVTRLRILRSLWNTTTKNGATVTDLCEDLRVSQPLMSWHLRILRRAGLVTTHRSGRQVYCSIDPAVTGEFGRLLQEYLASDLELEPATLPKPRLADPLPRVQGAG